MATLTINGQKVTVDDSFRSLSPEQQEATVNEIAQSISAAPEPSQGGGWMDTAGDVLKSAGSGIARGTADLVGLPGTIGDAINNGLSYVTGMPRLPQSPLSGQTIREAASTVTGGATDYAPQTTAGEFASTAGEFVPGALALGGGTLASALKYGVAPGLASEGAGQLTEGSAVEPYARVIAALATPAALSAGQRLISPFGGVAPERLAAAQTLRAEGVMPTAGQLTGSRNLKAMEGELGGGSTARLMDAQGEAFTNAAMQRAGGSGLATPENMTTLKDQIVTGLDDIAARNVLQADPKIGTDIGRVLTEYDRVLPTAQREIVGNMADDVINVFATNGGKMDGSIYKATRSRFTRMANSAKNSDPEFANAMRGLRDALDEGMSRSVSPDDAATWKTLRRQYGNMKVLEKAATGAGENAAMGNISPAKLRQAAVSGRAGQFSRAEGDFDRLAIAGNRLLAPLADSGTATRLNARTLGGIMSGVGAGVGAGVGSIPGAIAGTVIGSAAPAVVGRALMSRPVQAYLSNQAMGPAKIVDPRYAAVIDALLSRQQLPQQNQ